MMRASAAGLLAAGISVFSAACQPVPGPAVVVNASTPEGEWLSECEELAHGIRHRVYVDVAAGRGRLALLIFADRDCAGVYVMSDLRRNLVRAPAHSVDLGPVTLEGMPSGFVVLRTRDAESGRVAHALLRRLGSDAAYGLPDLPSPPPTTWARWLRDDPKVAAFAANPAGYAGALRFARVQGLP